MRPSGKPALHSEPSRRPQRPVSVKFTPSTERIYTRYERCRALPHGGETHIGRTLYEDGIQLSGGERRRTEIARAVAINPAFILLDEPFAGVDPIAVEDIQSIVATLKNKNIGVIITDHNVDETLAITDRAYLLYEGKVLKTGSPEELAADPEVRKRYLGKHFELRRSPTIDRLRQQGAEAQRSVSETDAEATHE